MQKVVNILPLPMLIVGSFLLNLPLLVLLQSLSEVNLIFFHTLFNILPHLMSEVHSMSCPTPCHRFIQYSAPLPNRSFIKYSAPLAVRGSFNILPHSLLEVSFNILPHSLSEVHSMSCPTPCHRFIQYSAPLPTRSFI